MNYVYSEYEGFKKATFEFEGREAIIVFPEKTEEKRRWMMKMEYFEAFPKLEIELLSRGWHLCYLTNTSRWGTDTDSDAKDRFAEFISSEFGLQDKFTCVGMSCGGICSVNFAVRYPERVAFLYLDAPVMNLLSCPMGFGIGEVLGGSRTWALEQLQKSHGLDLPSLLTYRDHPIDKIPILAQHKFPVALVYGADDTVVPYVENGIVLEKYYREKGLPLFCVGKEGCGHHPHGLEDNKELADFIEANT